MNPFRIFLRSRTPFRSCLARRVFPEPFYSSSALARSIADRDRLLGRDRHFFWLLSSSLLLSYEQNEKYITMATASVKMNDAFAKMQGSLSRYARNNDRRMVLRCLKDTKKYLGCIPMEPVDEGSKAGGANFRQLEEELLHESIVLNGVAFHSTKDFVRTLQELCLKLCDEPGVTINPSMLYERIVIHAAPTTSQADSFFTLNTVVGTSDLMLMPVEIPQHKSTRPIEINIFVADGSVHATMRSLVGYGLFRRTDVKPNDIKTGKMTGRPWVILHATVDERVNFSTTRGVRNMSVKLPNLY
jgi:hypothetical protein